ncbi:MAG: MoaD/ThiS family protein, partial [Anaerolineales bacterium]|nr:MoaD/ThiS family protein [Anaerolineales bacterium]
MMKKVKVLFFATLRDRAGAKSLEIEIPEGATVGQLKDQIGRDYPNLEQSMQSVVVAINREFAF